MAQPASSQDPLGDSAAPSASLAAERKLGRGLTCAALALVLFKLWLVAAQPISAVGHAQYDDRLFLELASSLLRGDWLGPYTHLTLAKGPMYSIFIAAVFLTGVPLFTAQHLFYAAACGALTRALRPLVPRRGVRFALFAVLLFNPITYDSVIHSRVLRQQIQHSLAFLVIAGLIALYARRGGPKRRLFGWALLTGLALPAFWMTREEGVWLLPCVGLFWFAAAVAVWRERAPDRRARLTLLALPAPLWAAGLALVATLNFRHYGVFTTCEFNQPDFKAAFGALLRIEHQHWRPYLVVPREVRERLYAVSPAFAELRGELEGPTGESWAGLTVSLTGLPASEHEIAGGWFMWALRRAVADTGHAKSGAEAAAYYRRLAKEINDACASGVLQAGPPRAGFMPPWRREYLPPLRESLQRTAWFFLTFDDIATATLGRSEGSREELALFADLTRERMIPPEGSPPVPPQQRWLDHVRLRVLEKIQNAYRHLALWAGGAALLAWLAAVGVALARRRWTYFGLVGAGLLGSCCAVFGIVALIDVTSFPALNTGYFSGLYGLWLLFWFVSGLALTEVLRPAGAGATPASAPPPPPASQTANSSG